MKVEDLGARIQAANLRDQALNILFLEAENFFPKGQSNTHRWSQRWDDNLGSFLILERSPLCHVALFLLPICSPATRHRLLAMIKSLSCSDMNPIQIGSTTTKRDKVGFIA